VHLAHPVAELAGEHDDLGDDQLGHAAGVAEGRVEDGHAAGAPRRGATWLVPMQNLTALDRVRHGAAS
jgi:hypothetical protein